RPCADTHITIGHCKTTLRRRRSNPHTPIHHHTGIPYYPLHIKHSPRPCGPYTHIPLAVDDQITPIRAPRPYTHIAHRYKPSLRPVGPSPNIPLDNHPAGWCCVIPRIRRADTHTAVDIKFVRRLHRA